jgi:hypothetical protein
MEYFRINHLCKFWYVMVSELEVGDFLFLRSSHQGITTQAVNKTNVTIINEDMDSTNSCRGIVLPTKKDKVTIKNTYITAPPKLHSKNQL